MPVIRDKKILAAVRVLVNEWAREYKADFRKVPASTIVGDNKSFAKDQVEFIKLYVSHLLLAGTIPATLKRIKRFLSMQKVVNDDAELEIHFVGGAPIEVIVFVDDVDDVDIADVSGCVDDFEEMFVYKQRPRRWSRKTTQAFVEALKKDVGFDGIKCVFKPDFSGSTLHIKCRFIE